jgi:hypothetical protein
MKKLAVIALLSLVGCKPGVLCPVVDSVATSFSDTVSSRCGCANTAKVQSDILGAVNSALVCASNTKDDKGGAIASIVCPIAATLVTSLLANEIPQSWQCSSAVSCVGDVVQIATAACEIIPL